MADIRRSATGSLVLTMLPANGCLALMFGNPEHPVSRWHILRLYRTKDDAFADWERINRPSTLSQS